MLLVAGGGRATDDFRHNIYGGKGPHAANNANGLIMLLFHKNTPTPLLLRVLTLIIPRPFPGKLKYMPACVEHPVYPGPRVRV